jgi:hypothetical protein
LHLDLAGTLLDARETTEDPALNPTSNDVLPLSSRLTATSLAELYSRLSGPVNRAALGLRYSYRSSRFADLAGQIVLPAQNFVDLELSASLFRDQLLARAAVRNAFDANSSDLIGLPAPGRSWHGTVEAWF